MMIGERLYRSTNLPRQLLATNKVGGALVLIEEPDLRRAVYLSEHDVKSENWFEEARARLNSQKPTLVLIGEHTAERLRANVFVYSQHLTNLYFEYEGQNFRGGIDADEYAASTADSDHVWLQSGSSGKGYFLLGLLRSDLWAIDSISTEATGRLVLVLQRQSGSPQVETRLAEIRYLGLEGLHPEILARVNELYTNRHYSEAIFEATKVVEKRVQEQSGLERIGKSLMTHAFSRESAVIKMSHETGVTAGDEQEGFMSLFVGAILAIKNPKSHGLVRLDDPQRALEYLAFLSLLMRRLDDAAKQ